MEKVSVWPNYFCPNSNSVQVCNHDCRMMGLGHLIAATVVFFAASIAAYDIPAYDQVSYIQIRTLVFNLGKLRCLFYLNLV